MSTDAPAVATATLRNDHLMIGDQRTDGPICTGMQVLRDGSMEVAWDGTWYGPFKPSDLVHLRRPREAPVRPVDPVRGIRAAQRMNPELEQALRAAVADVGDRQLPQGGPPRDPDTGRYLPRA